MEGGGVVSICRFPSGTPGRCGPRMQARLPPAAPTANGGLGNRFVSIGEQIEEDVRSNQNRGTPAALSTEGTGAASVAQGNAVQPMPGETAWGAAWSSDGNMAMPARKSSSADASPPPRVPRHDDCIHRRRNPCQLPCHRPVHAQPPADRGSRTAASLYFIGSTASPIDLRVWWDPSARPANQHRRTRSDRNPEKGRSTNREGVG
jgi:hypothetical protein